LQIDVTEPNASLHCAMHHICAARTAYQGNLADIILTWLSVRVILFDNQGIERFHREKNGNINSRHLKTVMACRLQQVLAPWELWRQCNSQQQRNEPL
jgi:hypothetical protein